jgi:hypothetical protein
MFRSEATDTRMGSGQQVELKTERFAMAHRLSFGYTFVRPESEQNCSLLKRGQVQKHDLDIWRSQSKSAYQLRQLLIECGFHEPDAELPLLARADAQNLEGGWRYE